MNIDRNIFLSRPFAFSGGDNGRCYSLPTNPQVSATEAACFFAPTHSTDRPRRTEEFPAAQPTHREPELAR